MSQFLESLIQAVPGVVYQFRFEPDGGWRFLYLSDGIKELYECSPEAACADPLLMMDCVLKEDRESLRCSIDRATSQLIPWFDEFRIQTPSGAIKWVRGQARPEPQADGSVLWNGILLDISQNKADEAHLLRLQSLHASIIEAGRLINTVQNQDELFRGVCRVGVELAGMKMVWIGMPNAEKRQLEAVARFGSGVEILNDPEFFVRLDREIASGQAATAFAEGRTVINQDFLRHPLTCPWQDLARHYGFGSSASFAIRDGDKPVAVLTVYRGDINGFDDESVALIERLSSDISHALTAFSVEAERKRLQETLQFRQHGLDFADEEIYWVNSRGRICEVNQTACRMLRYSRDELLQLSVFDIDPNVHPLQWPERWQALKENKSLRFDSSHKSSDGAILPTEVCVNYFEYQGAEYCCTLVRNLSERKIIEQALAESQERFNLFMDNLPAATFIKEHDGTIIFANRYMDEVLGARNWLGKSTYDLFPREVAEQMIADDQRALEAGYEVLEEQVPSVDGELRTYQTQKFKISRHDQPPLLGGIAIDITERKQMEERVWNLAYFDVLTNLPNRRMLLDRLGQALLRAKRYQNSLALMFMDLDHFKQVNDTLGHDVGDALLKEVAVRLQSCVRGEDTVSRHGGDEFIILLPEIARPQDAALVAEKIIREISAPFQLAGHALNVTTSIGIAVYPVNGSDDVQELLKKADKAMYAAKDAGRNGYQFFRE